MKYPFLARPRMKRYIPAMTSRKRTSRLGPIEREILSELSATDMLIGFLCSGRSAKRMSKIANDRAMYRYRRKHAIERLIRQGLIRKRGEHASITNRGLLLIDNAISRNRKALDSQVWDQKWRIVSYDIPESHKLLRDTVRRVLKRAGFIKFQQSIWIFPYECAELAQLIREETKLGNYILYGVLERVEDEKRLRKHFSLN